MQTSVSQRPLARNAPSPDARLPYPDLPRLPHDGGAHLGVFWLCAWMRSVAELESFNALRKSAAIRTKRDKSVRLSMGLIGAERMLREDAANTLGHVVSTGGLLYAWAGTTAIQAPA